MSDLLGNLSMATRSLEAQRLGLEVVGQNIANVNTPGYSRRTALLAEVPPYDRWSAGNGADVIGIRASRDLLLEYRLRQEQTIEQREATLADSLGLIETSLGTAGASVDLRLSAFFDAFASLAQDPVSSTARQNVVQQGGQLARSIQEIAQRLSTAQREADRSVATTVDEINALTERIASLNASIARVSGAQAAAESLRDEQSVAVSELSKLIDIDVMQRADGGVDVTFANGRPLAIGDNAYAVTTATGADGLLELRSGDAVVTDEVTGGRIGGLLHVRDVLIPDYQTKLDELAYAVVDQVNTLHDAGFDLAGNDAGNFFVPLTGVAGAARAISVEAAVTADPSLVAAASAPAAGDNGMANAIAQLRDQRILNGGLTTLGDGWAELVYRVGQDSASARREQASRGEIVRQVDALRDAVSGVSLDEEAALMLRFQRAYEANARFFQVIDQSLDTLMALVRV